MIDIASELASVERLTKDLKLGAATLSPHEARFLVDAYYSLQDYRIQAANQVRALTVSGEPHSVLVWLQAQAEVLEKQILRALDRWTDEQPMGRWAKGVTGIGPVISAGLLAHIDITKAPTAGHIWRFAGLDPTVEWLGKEKSRALVEEVLGGRKKITYEDIVTIGQRLNRRPENVKAWDAGAKTLISDPSAMSRATLMAGLARRPWNAGLKVLCWKMGQSFVKVSGNPKAVYGRLYVERRAHEDERNERGELAAEAAKALAAKRIGKDTEAYKAYSVGKLPPAHLHARATRWTVKIFLSHLHAEWYRQHYRCEPPAPYPIAILGHAHMIEP